MNCPVCGKKMGVGFVESQSRIFFVEQRKSVIWPFWTDNDETKLCDFWSVPTCIAYICRSCKKVVIDYTSDAINAGKRGKHPATLHEKE